MTFRENHCFCNISGQSRIESIYTPRNITLNDLTHTNHFTACIIFLLITIRANIQLPRIAYTIPHIVYYPNPTQYHLRPLFITRIVFPLIIATCIQAANCIYNSYSYLFIIHTYCTRAKPFFQFPQRNSSGRNGGSATAPVVHEQVQTSASFSQRGSARGQEQRLASGEKVTFQHAQSLGKVQAQAHQSEEFAATGSSGKSETIRDNINKNFKTCYLRDVMNVFECILQTDAEISSTSVTPTPTTSSRPLSPEDEILDADDPSAYETLKVSSNRRSYHERKPSSSSSSNTSNSGTPKQRIPQVLVNGQTEIAMSGTRKEMNVKLRDSAAERRERRKASSKPDEPPHSSSGNWSASSESGRASVNSETTTTTHPPR